MMQASRPTWQEAPMPIVARHRVSGANFLAHAPSSGRKLTAACAWKRALASGRSEGCYLPYLPGSPPFFLFAWTVMYLRRASDGVEHSQPSFSQTRHTRKHHRAPANDPTAPARCAHVCESHGAQSRCTQARFLAETPYSSQAQHRRAGNTDCCTELCIASPFAARRLPCPGCFPPPCACWLS